MPNFQLKYCKSSLFLRGNWLLFNKLKEKLKQLKEKLKTQDKNLRFWQKRSLPKTRPKKPDVF